MSFEVPFLRVKPLSTPLLGQKHPFQAMASNRVLIPMSQTCNALITVKAILLQGGRRPLVTSRDL